MEQNLNQCSDQGCGSGSACIRIQFFSPGSGPGRKKLKNNNRKKHENCYYCNCNLIKI